MVLSTLIFLPVVFALVLAVWPQRSTIRQLALGFSFLQFAVSLLMIKDFDTGFAGLQFVEKFSWIERFGISFFVGID